MTAWLPHMTEAHLSAHMPTQVSPLSAKLRRLSSDPSAEVRVRKGPCMHGAWPSSACCCTCTLAAP